MTRVVLADDSVIFREALAELLTARGFEVCGLAGDADGLLAVAADVRPDVCVVDIRMPPRGLDDGLRAAHEILRTRTSAVLLLSQHVHVTHALDLLSGGARGFAWCAPGARSSTPRSPGCCSASGRRSPSGSRTTG